jgi:hypothetical protein
MERHERQPSRCIPSRPTDMTATWAPCEASQLSIMSHSQHHVGLMWAQPNCPSGTTAGTMWVPCGRRPDAQQDSQSRRSHGQMWAPPAAHKKTVRPLWTGCPDDAELAPHGTHVMQKRQHCPTSSCHVSRTGPPRMPLSYHLALRHHMGPMWTQICNTVPSQPAPHDADLATCGAHVPAKHRHCTL